MEKKNLQLERLVFFSDAVVAIAITLLALEIKIEPPKNGQLAYADISAQWRTFAAFGLSFFTIGNFWFRHYIFFVYIDRIDGRLLGWNLLWLLLITLVPFSTSLISNYFSQSPAMVAYSLCMVLIAICQNYIWDHASGKGYLDQQKATRVVDWWNRLFCHVDMSVSLIGLGVAFFSPVSAFVVLAVKLPILGALQWYLVWSGRVVNPPTPQSAD